VLLFLLGSFPSVGFPCHIFSYQGSEAAAKAKFLLSTFCTSGFLIITVARWPIFELHSSTLVHKNISCLRKLVVALTVV
jgi:hypothetical protein